MSIFVCCALIGFWMYIWRLQLTTPHCGFPLEFFESEHTYGGSEWSPTVSYGFLSRYQPVYPRMRDELTGPPFEGEYGVPKCINQDTNIYMAVDLKDQSPTPNSTRCNANQPSNASLPDSCLWPTFIFYKVTPPIKPSHYFPSLSSPPSRK